MVRLIKYDKNGIGFWLWQVSIYFLFLLKLVTADGGSWDWEGEPQLPKERFFLSDQRTPAKCKDPYYDYEASPEEEEPLNEAKRGKRDECDCVTVYQKTFPPSCGTTCACSCSPTCMCSGLPMHGLRESDSEGRPKRAPDCPECTSVKCLPSLKCNPPKCDVRAQPTCPILCLTPCPCPNPPKPCCPKALKPPSDLSLSQRRKKECNCQCPTIQTCPTKCTTCRPPCCYQTHETPPECPPSRASCRPTCCPPPKEPCCPALKEAPKVVRLNNLIRRKRSFFMKNKIDAKKTACCTTKDPCAKPNPCCDPGPDNPDCPAPCNKKPGPKGKCSTTEGCTTECTTKDPCAPTCSTEKKCTTACTTKDPCAPTCSTEKKCTTACTTEDSCASSSESCGACFVKFADEKRKRLAKRSLDYIVDIIKRRAFEKMSRRVRRQCGPSPCPTLGTTCRHTTTQPPLICPTAPPPVCMSTCTRTTMAPPRTCPPTCPNPCDIPKRPCDVRLKGSEGKTSILRSFFRFKRGCQPPCPPKCACGDGSTCCPTTPWNDNRFWPPTRPVKVVENGIPAEEIRAPWMEETDQDSSKDEPFSDLFLTGGGNYVGHRFKRDDPAIDRGVRGAVSCSMCTCITKPCPNCTTCPYPCNTVKLAPGENDEFESLLRRRRGAVTCLPSSSCPPVGCKQTCCVSCRPRPCVSCSTCSVKRRRSPMKKRLFYYPLNILDYPMTIDKTLEARRGKRQPLADMAPSFNMVPHQVFILPSKNNGGNMRPIPSNNYAPRTGRRVDAMPLGKLAGPGKRGCDPCAGKATCPCLSPTGKTCGTTTCPILCEQKCKKRHILLSERDWVNDEDTENRDQLKNALRAWNIQRRQALLRKVGSPGRLNKKRAACCPPATYATCKETCPTSPKVQCCPTLPTCPPPSCKTCPPECPKPCKLKGELIRKKRLCCTTTTAKSCVTPCVTEEPPEKCASTSPPTCASICPPTTCPPTPRCKRSIDPEILGSQSLDVKTQEGSNPSDVLGSARGGGCGCKSTTQKCTTTCSTTTKGCGCGKKRACTTKCTTPCAGEDGAGGGGGAGGAGGSTTCGPGKANQFSRAQDDTSDRLKRSIETQEEEAEVAICPLCMRRERQCGCKTTTACTTTTKGCCGGGGGGGSKGMQISKFELAVTERMKRAPPQPSYPEILPQAVKEELELAQIS